MQYTTSPAASNPTEWWRLAEEPVAAGTYERHRAGGRQRAPPRQLAILQLKRRRSVFAGLTLGTQPCAIKRFSHARTLLPPSVPRTLPAAQSDRIVAPAWQLQTISCSCQSDSSKKRLASP